VPVDPGDHTVELDGVAANCTVLDNPRTAQGGTPTEVPFVITCVAAGTVRLTTVTTGIDMDQDGYLACIDGAAGACSREVWVSANTSTDIGEVPAGSHTVTLSNLAGNCTVSGGTTRPATVPADGTVDVRFDVGCLEAPRIAYSLYGTIAVVRSNGSAVYSLTAGFAPAWSPDGARIAYECGQDLCAINADSTGFARLTLDAANNRHPTWSPDGSRIAFAATHASSVPSVFETDLYVMAANGSGVVRLTQDVGFLGRPAWSPDGTRIVFDCRVEAANDDLCSVNADGTGFARLTNDPARDYGAAWKPDGSTLAFSTTRYGSDEIAHLDVAGGAVTRIGVGLSGFAPAWSPDGSQLAVVRVYEDYYGNTYDAILVGQADGSGFYYLTVGDQPAWKPMP
jgi:dipeptidyl aminopeptidase/acylaminoacyl peptidase